MKKIKNFEKVIEFAPDAMIIVNSNGVIEYVNLQAEKLFIYKREDLIGKQVEILVPDRFTKNHKKLKNSYLNSPHIRKMGAGVKLFGKRSNGSEFPIEINLSPIEKEGLIAAAIRDVTENFSNNYLINKTKQLEDFAYITSHNLRSPVSNLTSLVNFYKIEKTEAGKKLLFNKFELTVEKLGETLNNLMDVLIIQQGANTVKSNINFNSVFKKAVANLEFYIKENNAQISVDFSEAPTIQYPKLYMESIILNLLSNALKYSSPKRTPIIQIKTYVINNKTHLTITDNGLGIDLKKHGDEIFGLNKVFHKHPEAKGVGLFITKVQVDSMGGQIKIESEVDKGASFTIIF